MAYRRMTKLFQTMTKSLKHEIIYISNVVKNLAVSENKVDDTFY